MKYTLPIAARSAIAAAVLAACAASVSAQTSNVIIYGRLDVAVTHVNKGTSPLAGSNITPAWGLNGSDSWLGFRGEENLGGGMKARFKIEQRFNTKDGTFRANGTSLSPLPAWFGESSVGLDTPYGSLDMGRLNGVAGFLPVGADPFLWDTVASTVGLVAPNGYGLTDIVKNINSILYRTPRFAGTSATLGYSFGDNNPRGRGFGFNVIHASGPLYAGVGHEVRDTATTRDNITFLVGMYDFGPIKPILAASQSEIAHVKKSFYSIGAIAPLGTGQLKAVYAVGHPRLFPTTQAPKTTKIGLGYHHPLSKRTKLFTDVGSSKSENRTRTTAFDAGLQVTF